MPSTPLRVLESVDPPGRTTKYIDQVVRYAPDDVQFAYFSWPTALVGRYDVFHVHWPEFLMRSRRPAARIAQRMLFRILMARLALTRTPVVRTQHNLEPHERGDAAERRLLDRLDRLTTVRVTLNAATEPTTGPLHRLVPHGDYREVLAEHPRSRTEPGRLLFLGRIEPYKAAPSLVDAFEAVAEPGASLGIVGSPAASERRALEERAARWARTDARLDLRLEHVSDADMVVEMSRAEAVVLPYDEMHNSGVLLVALSLGRPVIVPASAANDALAAEVGEGWIIRYQGAFDAEALRSSLAALRSTPADRPAPDLRSRDWSAVAAGYAEAFRAARAESRRDPVFVNVGGQRDNIGDSLLRRAYLDALRPLGPLHAYVGPDAGYTSGLGLRDGDTAYTSPARWLVGAARSALLRRTVFGVNTGEVVGTAEEHRKGRWQPLLARLVRLRRGAVVLAGVSIRPGTSKANTSLPALAPLAASPTWRDSATRDEIGRGTVQPDWAFGLGSAPEQWAPVTERPVIAVTMRGDRPMPGDDWFDAIRTLAESTGCTPVALVQVRRDAERAAAIAERLGCESLDWGDDLDHAAQEARVRELYGRSLAVVSDRIHALIVGYTEGAVPLGFSTGGTEKVVRSLRPATEVAFCAEAGTYTSTWTAALEKRDRLAADLSAARARLAEVTTSLARR